MVVGKGLPRKQASIVAMPFHKREGLVSKRSPPASALSRFCKEPMTLKRPIGKMTARYFQPEPVSMDQRSPNTILGGKKDQTMGSVDIAEVTLSGAIAWKAK